jgi:hypothetical protein
MKPPKNLYPLAAWLLRISFVFLAYILFWDELRSLDYHQLTFWIDAAFSLFSILLFIGGFMSKSDITIISSFVLFGLSLYKLYTVFSWPFHLNAVLFLLMASSALVLFTMGNK